MAFAMFRRCLIVLITLSMTAVLLWALRPNPVAALTALATSQVADPRLDPAASTSMPEPAANNRHARNRQHGKHESKQIKRECNFLSETKQCLSHGKVSRGGRAVTQWIPRKSTLLDLGAGYGMTSCLLSQHVTGRVFAVEPDVQRRRALRRNVEYNTCSRVEVLDRDFSGASEDEAAEASVGQLYDIRKIRKQAHGKLFDSARIACAGCIVELLNSELLQELLREVSVLVLEEDVHDITADGPDARNTPDCQLRERLSTAFGLNAVYQSDDGLAQYNKAQGWARVVVFVRSETPSMLPCRPGLLDGPSKAGSLVDKCGGDLRVPDPMTEASLSAYQTFSQVPTKQFFTKSHRLQMQTEAPCDSIIRLVERGLRWNALGMDFGSLKNARQNGSTGLHSTEFDMDIERVVKFYYQACDACFPLLELDHTHRAHPINIVRLKSGRENDLLSFRENGFLTIQDYGVNIDDLMPTVQSALRTGKQDRVFASPTHLPELEPLIQNNELLELASWYMGSDVQITGYKVVRIGDKVRQKNYVSGYWHHDGCGSRLKMFVFLQDVESDRDCPTEIAVGSQRTAFYTYGGQKGQRYLDSYVYPSYTVKKMFGRRGGGFIFDTNTVHKGRVQDEHARRDAVIIDIASSTKLNAHAPPTGPCPETGTYRVNDKRSTFRFPA